MGCDPGRVNGSPECNPLSSITPARAERSRGPLYLSCRRAWNSCRIKGKRLSVVREGPGVLGLFDRLSFGTAFQYRRDSCVPVHASRRNVLGLGCLEVRFVPSPISPYVVAPLCQQASNWLIALHVIPFASKYIKIVDLPALVLKNQKQVGLHLLAVKGRRSNHKTPKVYGSRCGACFGSTPTFSTIGVFSVRSILVSVVR